MTDESFFIANEILFITDDTSVTTNVLFIIKEIVTKDEKTFLMTDVSSENMTAR